MSDFQDYFSTAADDYARYRPVYPAALYDALVDLCSNTDACWDCATGNGQAALALAERFDRVYATDASAEQLARATQHPKIEFSKALAERSGLADDAVDLVTVAAAAHWFDHDAFYPEVGRVLRPGGVVALWSYNAAVQVSPEVDRIVDHFTENILGDYWAEDLHYVRARYETLPFPFEPIEMPQLAGESRGNVETLLGGMRSWSGRQAYLQKTGTDPVELVQEDLTNAWPGGPRAEHTIRWPLFFRVAVV